MIFKWEAGMRTRTALIVSVVSCLALIIGVPRASAQTGTPSESAIGQALRPAPNLGEHQGLPTFGRGRQAPQSPAVQSNSVSSSPSPPPPKSRKSRAAVATTSTAAAPQSAAPPSISFNTIQFTFNSAQLTPGSIDTLRNLGNALNHELADQKSFLIEGHTDATGGRYYNINLSRRRADAVKNYLVRKAGVSPSRLKTAGKGASEPINPADPYAADNRRVVVKNLGG
jgi:OmpA-OmpF porin, OOP family